MFSLTALSRLLQTMQAHAAVFRTGSVLKEGCDKMDAVYQTMDDIKTFDRGATLFSVFLHICTKTVVVNSLCFFLPFHFSRHCVEYRLGRNAGAAEPDAQRRPDHQFC